MRGSWLAVSCAIRRWSLRSENGAEIWISVRAGERQTSLKDVMRIYELCLNTSGDLGIGLEV